MTDTVVLQEYAKATSRRKELIKRYATIIGFLAPFMIAFIVFFVFPLFYGVYISLTNFKYATPSATDNFVFNNFKWYSYLLNPAKIKVVRTGGTIKYNDNIYFESFWRSIIHSVIFALIMVPVAILVPLGLAILINKKPPFYKGFRAAIYLPAIVPLTAAGSIFMFIFMNKDAGGIFNNLFGTNIQFFNQSMLRLGKMSEGVYFIDVAWAWVPVFVMCFWGGWGGNFIILSAGLQNVPKNLYEAADIDGCSKWRKTISITLAGIKPQLVLTLFTTIIGYLGLYGQNFVLCNGGPAYSNVKLTNAPGGFRVSTAIYFIQDIVANNLTYRSSLYGLAAAASIIFALIVGTISGIQMYATRDKKSGYKISEGYAKWIQAKK